MRCFYVTFTLIFLWGCASRLIPLEPSLDYDSLIFDEAFDGYENVNVESVEQIFFLSDEAKRFVDRTVSDRDGIGEQMRSLARSIFDYSKLDLLYRADATTTASETFKNKAANCLSMSIMTYAMAKRAGFTAQFQDIEIPEYWTRRDGYSLLNGHVNVRLVPRSAVGIFYLYPDSYIVDFDPQNTSSKFSRKIVSEQDVVSMFYNNKGVDALVKNDFITAYAYFKKAINLTPDFVSAWANLGLLYRKNNLLELAEKTYLYAMKVDDGNLTVYDNLAFLYRLTDRNNMADKLIAKVKAKRLDNPYYHYILGEQDFDEQEYEQALEHYRNALRLDRGKHEIYYGLAKAHHALGNTLRSKRYLILAKRKSNNRDEQNRYQGKLNALLRNKS